MGNGEWGVGSGDKELALLFPIPHSPFPTPHSPFPITRSLFFSRTFSFPHSGESFRFESQCRVFCHAYLRLWGSLAIQVVRRRIGDRRGVCRLGLNVILRRGGGEVRRETDLRLRFFFRLRREKDSVEQVRDA